MPITTSCKTLVEQANARIRTLSVEQAAARLNTEDTVFVDIRDVRELEREGMIPGAVHAPRGMLEFWVDPQSPYYREIFGSGKEFILYCAGAWRSALATATLQDFKNLFTILRVRPGCAHKTPSAALQILAVAPL